MDLIVFFIFGFASGVVALALAIFAGHVTFKPLTEREKNKLKENFPNMNLSSITQKGEVK